MNLSTHVLRFRLKDKHAKLLRELAREVNLVWNYVSELSMKVRQRESRFLSGYDFHPFTKGASKAGLGLHSQTIQAIGEGYATRRKQACRTKLRWRVSGGSRDGAGKAHRARKTEFVRACSRMPAIPQRLTNYFESRNDIAAAVKLRSSTVST